MVLLYVTDLIIMQNQSQLHAFNGYYAEYECTFESK